MSFFFVFPDIFIYLPHEKMLGERVRFVKPSEVSGVGLSQGACLDISGEARETKSTGFREQPLVK